MAEDELSEFRIEIPDSAIAAANRDQWRRMAEYLDRRHEEVAGAEIDWWACPEGGCWVYRGKAPSEVVAFLQAAARGDDLGVLLDRFDGDRPLTTDDDRGCDKRRLRACVECFELLEDSEVHWDHDDDCDREVCVCDRCVCSECCLACLRLGWRQ